MILKVVEFRYSEGRKTSTHYTVYYEHAIREYNDGNLPNTVLNFILADDGKCKAEYGKDIPVKKTTYTR